MDFYALARHFVCMVVAATLSLTVSVIEKMLPHRPEWLEKIALLEAQFRAIAAGRATDDDTPPDETAEDGATATHPDSPARAPASDGGTGAAGGGMPTDLQGLVDGYGKLLEFTQQVRLRGLNLDPEFCERVEREWSVKTLLSYMISADKSLKEQASEAHDEAAKLLTRRGQGSPQGGSATS